MPGNSKSLSVAQFLSQLNGSPKYLGTIQSTGTNVISNIASAILAGDMLLIQPDATCYVLPSNHPSAPETVNSATTGVKLVGDEKMYITLGSGTQSVAGQSYLQLISASGTVNLKVWRLE